MEYTEQQKKEFKNQFAKKRRKQLIVAVLCSILSIPPLAAFALYELNIIAFEAIPLPTLQIFVLILFAVLVSVIIFTKKNWRCPACKKDLGNDSNSIFFLIGKDLNIIFCPNCGIRLK